MLFDVRGALMPGIGPHIVASVLPLWIAAVAASVLVLIIGTLAFVAPRTELLASLARSALTVLGAILCGSLVWAFFDGTAAGNRAAERRVLEMRADELEAQALIPGSPLACIDGMAGDAVATACEKEVFASPGSTAAAISYVAARLTLLSDMTGYARSGSAHFDAAMRRSRRALEADRYGLLAQVLETSGECGGQNCPALKLLHDASQVRKNLLAHTLDHYVEQYQSVWAKLPETSAGATAASVPTAAATANAHESRRSKLDIDFPTAASIPAVSIMNPEPKGPAGRPGLTGSAGDTAAALPPAGPARTDPVWLPLPTPTRP